MKFYEYFAFIKLAMLLGLLTFFLFWYVPNMRSQSAYRHAMDQVFDEAYSCSQRAFSDKNYAAVRPCFSRWDKWNQANESPGLGWHLPWFLWHEAPET